jgi:hypothetical protein
MALRLHHRIAVGYVAQILTITTAFKFHDSLPGRVMIAIMHIREVIVIC